MDYQAQEVLTERIMGNGHIEPFDKGTGNLGLTRSFGEELLFVFCSVCIHLGLFGYYSNIMNIMNIITDLAKKRKICINIFFSKHNFQSFYRKAYIYVIKRPFC